MIFFDTAYKNILTLGIAVLLAFSGCATTQQATDQDVKTEPAVSDTSENLPGQDRPVPNPITTEIPNAFYSAVETGTRTMSGEPGAEYWQQWADYKIDVELLTDEKKVKGKGTITYYNNSPDNLNVLLLELSQNLHKEGVERNESAEVTGGVTLHKVSYEGKELNELESSRDRTGYGVNGTLLVIRPSNTIAPGDTVQLEIEWDFKVPQQGASGRMGYSEDNLFFISYWYPQMRVYDDVIGWLDDPFTGNAEFYHGFGNYNVNITVPEQWLVAATGELTNSRDVLKDEIHQRMQKGHQSDSVIHVVTEEDFGNVTQSTENGKVTWSYNAEHVRDFAFSVTKESMWDATRSAVGDHRDGDGKTDYSFINAIYRSSAPLWTNGAEFTRHSVGYLSEYTGLEYPWPHMTSVEGGGIIGGGMEFPMMTIIGDYRGRPETSLYAVIAHEIAHMWVPMQVSTNERRYSWIDEGTTTFNENRSFIDYFPERNNPEQSEFQSYLQIAGSDYEGPIMRWSDYHYNGFAYGIASYPKPAAMLVSLRNLLGEETFQEAFEAFLERWRYKHPYPWDLFNTFEDVSGRDLGWFWRSWYYETWVLDQAVGNVTETEAGTEIVIEDYGEVPMPATVEITLSDGSTLTREVPVETWLRGNTRTVITIEPGAVVTKVVIDPDRNYPDMDRSNNSWEN